MTPPVISGMSDPINATCTVYIELRQPHPSHMEGCSTKGLDGGHLSGAPMQGLAKAPKHAHSQVWHILLLHVGSILHSK